MICFFVNVFLNWIVLIVFVCQPGLDGLELDRHLSRDSLRYLFDGAVRSIGREERDESVFDVRVRRFELRREVGRQNLDRVVVETESRQALLDYLQPRVLCASGGLSLTEGLHSVVDDDGAYVEDLRIGLEQGLVAAVETFQSTV